MRAMAVLVLVSGCASASATPLAPEGPASEPQTARRDKVQHTSEPAPDKVSAVEPTRTAASITAGQPAATVTAATTVAVKGASVVELLSAGAEPRQALRYVFHRDESSHFRLHSTMTMDTVITTSNVSSMSAAPHAMHQILPATECSGTIHTRLVDADGTAHRDGWIGSFNVLSTPGVQPEVQSKVEQMLRGVGKLPFEDVIDTRGQVSESHMDLSSVRDPTLLETMQ